MKLRKSIMLAVIMTITAFLHAQDAAPENWFNLDKSSAGVQGVSTEKMYNELLKGKKGETVIVAVLDSGIDAEHEDLKDVMWVNPGEIAGNGKDDDGNGYIDDVHGWNFIGGKDGKNVKEDNLEVARLYAKLHPRFDGKSAASISKKERKDFERYQKVKETIESERESAASNLAQYKNAYDVYEESLNAIAKKLEGKELTLENVEAVELDGDQSIGIGQNILRDMLSKGSYESVEEVKEDILKDIKGGVDYFSSQLEYHYNPDFDPRSIVGDNYNNPDERYYGNNDVEGPDARHGTHVAGIIAAVRDNDKGMKGVADNVQIMSVRTVPDGDERDKDVANAIRYAVDNGASIINMSFGKSFSWNKKIVDDAVRYAIKNDVLLVHAAGNSGENTDVANNFPNDRYQKKKLFGKKIASSWIEVGALNWTGGEKSAASFSNYAKENVDLFAPGVKIYSTVPDNEYENLQGTSMASPVVAGVAAVLRSYYPDLSAQQVKDILMSTVVPLNETVIQPGSDEKVPFSSLSVTGGVVNAYKAAQKASKVKGKRKKKHKKRTRMHLKDGGKSSSKRTA